MPNRPGAAKDARAGRRGKRPGRPCLGVFREGIATSLCTSWNWCPMLSTGLVINGGFKGKGRCHKRTMAGLVS